MPGSPTPNKGYALPTVFGDLNAWGTELNSNFSILDLNVGGTLSMSISGATATVSGTNLENSGFKFSGTLSVLNTVSFSSYAGFAFINNGTTGSQNISCGISGGAFVTVQPGESVPIWSDGTNFYRMAVLGGGLSGTNGSGAVVLTSGATLVNATGIIPPGTIVDYAGTAAPSGWLYCDGSAVSRTTYSALFAVCSGNYGNGDGVTTFNVPDKRGRTTFGYDSGNSTGRLTDNTSQGLSASSVGNTGGEQSHTLIIAELATHSHTITDPAHTHAITDPQHSHTVSDPQHSHGIVDSGHNHAISDPGHFHDALNGASFQLSGGGGGQNTGNGAQMQQATVTATAVTDIVIQTHVTGINLDYASTGVTNENNSTGITNNANYTGITVNSNGSSSAHNTIPPGLITGAIIKT